MSDSEGNTLKLCHKNNNTIVAFDNVSLTTDFRSSYRDTVDQVKKYITSLSSGPIASAGVT